jgi:XRE family aerobic/anaerobic benzoate catabolism transcriptional regulator
MKSIARATPRRGAQSAVSESQALIALPDSDPDFLKNLGRRVLEAREQRRLSRAALAREAHVSERYLAQLEAGEGNATVVLLRRLAAALGVGIVDLLDASPAVPERRMLRRFLDSLPADKLSELLHRLTAEFGQDPLVRRKRITLIGLRGAGKSTLGQALAKSLRRPFIELDKEIERDAGISLSEVFLLYGQAGYRRIERRCLERIINSQDEIVLSVGGGIVSEPETYSLLLLNCFTVWVKAQPEEHMARVVAQGDMRPMAGHAEAMEDLRNILTAREPLYSKADTTLDTSGRSVEESLRALQRAVTVT